MQIVSIFLLIQSKLKKKKKQNYLGWVSGVRGDQLLPRTHSYGPMFRFMPSWNSILQGDLKMIQNSKL